MQQNYLTKALKLVFILSVILLVGAFGIEYIFNLKPCTLCIYQRYVYGLGAFIIPFYFLKKKFYIVCLIFINYVIGLLLSLYQTLLQYKLIPEDLINLSCLVGKKVITKVSDLPILPETSCSTIDFQIFGLSLAFWNFIIMSCVCSVIYPIIFPSIKNLYVSIRKWF